MSLFRTQFSIRDLEEFSGVKAHTIRIWEKRYGLLAPDRSGTNIRSYDLDELKVILNVAFLNKNGHKISRIAAMSLAERDRLVGETAKGPANIDEALNNLKIAMLAFDEYQFDEVCQHYQGLHGFRSLVEQLFVPLLEHIGVLWQTNAICPAQEHFVSNYIRQKLVAATDNVPLAKRKNDRTFVLFLAENEVHELGLLYVNYLLRSRGELTIYLGQSVPAGDLREVAAARDGELIMVTILMANPAASELPGYLEQLRSELSDRRINFLLTGSQLSKLDQAGIPAGMRTFHSMVDLVRAVDDY